MKSKVISLIILGSIVVGGSGMYMHSNNNQNPSEEIVQNQEVIPNKETDEALEGDNSELKNTETDTNNAETEGNITKASNENTEVSDNNTLSDGNKTEVRGKSVVTSNNKVSNKNNTVTNTNNTVSNKHNSVTNNNNTVTGNQQSNTVTSDKFMAEVEQYIFNKVNEERAKNGVSALSYNSTMQKYARIKSQDMGDKNYFSHEDLSGNNITVKMKADGVSFSAWGENIAYISGVSDASALAQQFMTNWMNSDGHRKNILSTNFSSIGVGVYKIGNKVYATQEFYR